MDIEKILKENKQLKQLLKQKDQELELLRAAFFKQQSELNQYLIANAVTQEKLLIAKVQRFMPKTEQVNKVVINEVEAVKKENKLQVGRKKGGSNFESLDFSNVFTETRYEEPSQKDCHTCGGLLTTFKEDERFEVEVIPASLKVIKVVKKTCKCDHCSKSDNKLYYPLSNNPFPGSILTPSFASYIAYAKYELGVPFHHLEKHLSQVLKADISKQTLSNWMQKVAIKLEPLFNQLKTDLKHNDAKVIHADETTLVVSKRPGYDENRKKSYVYVYSTSYYNQPIQIYDFHESRSIDKTAAWLSDYDGYLVCDDFAGYTKLAKSNPNIKLQRCFAHARRRFVDILKTVDSYKQKSTHSYKILSLINQLFSLERQYRDDCLTASEIVEKRKSEHTPILNELKTLIFDCPYKPNTPLETAVNYVKRLWDELTTYVGCGYLEISNNLAERAVKPFVINRKRFMTSGSYAGARYTTIIFSIIRCAIINNLDVQKYLIYVLKNIDQVNVKDLLPYSDSVAKLIKK